MAMRFRAGQSPIEGRKEQVTLHPAVIAAIGSVRFCPGKGICRTEFGAEIRRMQRTTESGP